MTTARGQETRERIVRAAAELFHLHGYYHTSIDAILQRAGVKKGNLYFHFRNKEELGYAVVEWFAAQFRDIFARTTGSAATLREQIRAFFGAMEAYHLEHRFQGGCPFGNLALEMGDNHPGMADHVDTVFRYFEGAIARLVEAAKERGEVRPEVDSEQLAQFILSTFEGATLITKVRKEITAFRHCREAVDAFLATLQPTPQGLAA
ncbi:MAG: TetR/AcrR family transcriptional regulator [Nitrospirae bacterium]|nr:MAG: TetR/AcrR family transcriptional regulator [Nitrospirota bacterium]